MNVNSLVTCIYEKGQQMLNDAISKVEKLNAVQQLTTMIIPPSTVNIMSNDEDHCFQCQGLGYITRNCPNIRFSNVMSMATLSWIVHIGFLLWEPQQNITNPDLTEATSIDQVPGTTMKTGTGEVIPDHNLIHFNRHCSSSHHDSYRDHSRS